MRVQREKRERECGRDKRGERVRQTEREREMRESVKVKSIKRGLDEDFKEK